MNFVIFFVLLVPACVYAKHDCNKTPTCYLSFNNKEGILKSEKDIRDTCNQYNDYLKCAGDYGKECWESSEYESKMSRVESDLAAIKKICTDDNYRAEYAKEVESFAKIQKNFKMCVLRYQLKSIKSTLTNDKDRKSKELCCAVKSFEDCSNDLCVDKCTPEAIKILNEVIALHESDPEKHCSDEERNRWTNCPEVPDYELMRFVRLFKN